MNRKLLSMFLILALLLGLTVPAMATGASEAPTEAPTTVAEVKADATLTKGTASEALPATISFVSANLFMINNRNTDETLVRMEFPNLPKLTNGTWRISCDGASSSYLRTNGEVAYADLTIANPTEGALKLPFTIYDNSNVEQATAVYTGTVSTYLTNNPPSANEMNSAKDKETMHYQSLRPSLTLMLPTGSETRDISIKLVKHDGQSIQAVSNPKDNPPRINKSNWNDSRYDFFTNPLYSNISARYLNANLYCVRPLEPDVQYDAEVYFGESTTAAYTVEDCLNVSEDMVLSQLYGQGVAGATTLEVSVNMDGGMAGDISLSLKKDGTELVTKQVCVYTNMYDNTSQATITLTLSEPLVADNNVNYILTATSKSGSTIVGELSRQLYVNTEALAGMIVPDHTLANFVLKGSGYDNDMTYVADLIKDGNSIASCEVRPVDGIFDVVFEKDGKILSLTPDTSYNVKISKKDDTNNNGQQEHYYTPQFSDSGTSSANANFGAFGTKFNFSCNLRLSGTEASAITDPAKLSLTLCSLDDGKAYSISGTFEQYNQNGSSSNYELTAKITKEQLPYGYYQGKIYYNGEEISSPKLNRFVAHNVPTGRAQDRQVGFNGMAAVQQVEMTNSDGSPAKNPKVEIRPAFETTPTATLSLATLADSNRPSRFLLPTTQDGTTAKVDWMQQYHLTLLNGDTVVGARSSLFYLLPGDQKDNTPSSFTATASTVDHGTLTLSKTEGPYGTMVYVSGVGDEGYKLKPNSVQVNGKPIYGRSFPLVTNATVTAEFLSDKPSQELTFATPVVEAKTYGDEAFTNTASTSLVSDATVSYESSDETVATVDSDGKVTIRGAGTTTIKATTLETEEFASGSAKYTLTVNKRALTITGLTATERSFDGTTLVTLTSGTLSDTVSGDTVNLPTEITGNMADANVGEDKAVTVSPITLTGADADNYTVTLPTDLTVNITKADAPEVTEVRKNLLFNVAHTDVAVSITGLPSDCGTTKFTAGDPTGTTDILDLQSVQATDTGIKFNTKIGEDKATATIPVTVEMQNYENATVNVVVTLLDKTPVVISGIDVSNKTYDGKPLTYPGSPTNDKGYTGEYEITWSTEDRAAPKDVGTYTLTVCIPDDDEKFMGELVLENLTITAKEITAKPKDISIKTNAALPTSFELEYSDLIEGDTIDVSGTPLFELQKSDGVALEDSKKRGTYVIKWTNSDEITLTNDNYTITKEDGKLTITGSSGGGGDDGSGDGSGDGGGGGGSTTSPSTPPDVVTGGNSSTATVETKPSTSGNKSSATVNSSAITNALAAAEKAAATNQTSPVIEIKVDTPKNATSLDVSIPKSSITDVANSKAESLTISSGISQVTLSAQTLDSLAKQAGGSDVKISFGAVNTEKSLNEKQRTAVGDAPVYDISIQSGNQQITGFDGGLLTVSLPHTPKSNENPAGIVVWYVNEQGNIEDVATTYDVKTKMVTFETNHLSLYAVGYDETRIRQNPFQDVAEGTYYYDAVLWAVAEQVTSGTSATTFSPDTSCTRAQVVTFLWNAMGKPTPTSTTHPFTDVKTGSYYEDAVLWAAEKGITGGTSATTFSPEAVVTRAQFVTFLHRAANAPAATGSNPFTDLTDTGAYYYNPVLWAYAEKVTNGTSATTFSPASTCTRAQVVTFLYNYLGK